MNRFKRIVALFAICCVVVGCSGISTAPRSNSFTIAVIPDTQNAVDFKHQKAEGFAIDSSDIFIEQMRTIAQHGVKQGGDIAFVASVGDVWQHQTSNKDPEHFARGVTAIDNPFLSGSLRTAPETLTVEIPKSIEGYQLISAAGIPFGVAPGNHDYDAIWSVAGFPPNLSKSRSERRRIVEDIGLLHIGGFDNFRSAFGSDTPFFKDKPWYISAYRGGANSAQVFTAGGYTFLHFAFEMQAGDDVLAWAQSVIDAHPGLPTIISTHDYLSPQGERKPSTFVDLALGDPQGNNSAETIWRKFISTNDQIFMVLCGHQYGQATRIDDNVYGHKVYQLLSDYQARGQAGLDAGQAHTNSGGITGIGDGWYRLMTFDFEDNHPTVKVTTYSSHYKKFAHQLPQYAQWYKHQEQPDMSDNAFLAADEFSIDLVDFYQRFGSNR